MTPQLAGAIRPSEIQHAEGPKSGKLQLIGGILASEEPTLSRCRA